MKLDLEKKFGGDFVHTHFMDERYMIGVSLDVVVKSEIVGHTSKLVSLDTARVRVSVSLCV